jgi:hypothetical protein
MGRVAAITTTRVTVETETSIVFRRAEAVQAWCPQCGINVLSITFHDDSPAQPVHVSQIQNWVGTNHFHYWVTVEGRAQICLPSLLQAFESVRPEVAHSKPKFFDRWRKQQ